MPQYRIKSVQTAWLLVSDGTEKSGTEVTTVPENQNPSTTIITIEPSLGDVNTVASVKGKAEFYVGVQSEVGGQPLIWKEDETKWQFVKVPNSNADYNVIPADGANLYWYDKFGIGRKFKIESGSQVVEKENIFEITAV